ncbi:hypothetical protein EYF80_008926 [Liparis tanakae]|uniref:Uncharacterized protein n=1 Tax=Liparis tanakae TaxID=230148 RepID=A0A4Z2ISW2_9TELE|nr:hypothetical protein EYF80_008926 [Liparis tanakae]
MTSIWSTYSALRRETLSTRCGAGFAKSLILSFVAVLGAVNPNTKDLCLTFSLKDPQQHLEGDVVPQPRPDSSISGLRAACQCNTKLQTERDRGLLLRRGPLARKGFGRHPNICLHLLCKRASLRKPGGSNIAEQMSTNLSLLVWGSRFVAPGLRGEDCSQQESPLCPLEYVTEAQHKAVFHGAGAYLGSEKRLSKVLISHFSSCCEETPLEKAPRSSVHSLVDVEGRVAMGCLVTTSWGQTGARREGRLADTGGPDLDQVRRAPGQPASSSHAHAPSPFKSITCSSL